MAREMPGNRCPNRAEYRWDIVFVVTGKPLPAQLHKAAYAQRAGLRVLMVILERGVDDVKIDKALISFDVRTINVSYKGVELRRIWSSVAVYWQLRKIVGGGLKPGGVLMTSSYDLLLMARVLNIGRRFKIRHEVADLHALQLSGSLLSRMLVSLERILLRGVDRLIVASPEFVTKYYGKLYAGRVVLLENVPDPETWTGFVRAPPDGRFRIGFIGIIRYPESVRQLILAVRQLAAEGLPVTAEFAGGDAGGLLSDLTEGESNFERRGPYEYTKDIKTLYSNIDLIYAVYDSQDRNCQIAMPNKFYEAIIAKIPILVARNTFLAQEVQRLGIGAAVMSGDVDGLAALLRQATMPGSWYAQALERVKAVDATPYFAGHNRALATSVLP